MESQLSGHHEKIYQRLFQHPMPHNLHWREVWSMFEAMADVETIEDDKGALKVTRNGQTLLLHRPGHQDMVDAKELTRICHFLEQSGGPAPPSATVGTHLLVVIDHREARIYSTELHGSVPQRIAPYDPFGFGRHLHFDHEDANGQRTPERKSFYEAVAKTLRGAQQIVMLGTGKGASSAMEQLLADLKCHHHDLAMRIVGSTAVNEHHLTEDQLLAKARDLFVST